MSFQSLIKLIDYDMPVVEALTTPRFGTFPDSSSSKKISVKLDRNWLDPRIDEDVVKVLKKRGLKFQQKGLVDTGLGAAIRFESDESATAVTAPLPYFSNAFGH
jgi:gamma-glutamyltranspeptidase